MLYLCFVCNAFLPLGAARPFTRMVLLLCHWELSALSSAWSCSRAIGSCPPFRPHGLAPVPLGAARPFVRMVLLP